MEHSVDNRADIGSSPVACTSSLYFFVKCRRGGNLSTNGSVAQLVEHRSETARVVSANLTGTTIYISHIYQYSTYFWLPQDKSNGEVAQLVEHLVIWSMVRGSNPFLPTNAFLSVNIRVI